MERQDTGGKRGSPGDEGGGAPGPGRRVDAVATALLDAAVEVHRTLGPGFGESVYEEALDVELTLRGVSFTRQVPVTIGYKDHVVGDARLDMLVADLVVVELKAVEHIAPVHLAQALSYLRATGRTLALVINFNVPLLLRGVRRVIEPRRLTP